MIERWGERDDSGARDTIIRRLNAHDAAKGGGADNRADGLSPQRDMAKPCRHRSRRAAAGTARGMLRVVGVARGSGGKIGKLGRHCFSQK